MKSGNPAQNKVTKAQLRKHFLPQIKEYLAKRKGTRQKQLELFKNYKTPNHHKSALQKHIDRLSPEKRNRVLAQILGGIIQEHRINATRESLSQVRSDLLQQIKTFKKAFPSYKIGISKTNQSVAEKINSFKKDIEAIDILLGAKDFDNITELHKKNQAIKTNEEKKMNRVVSSGKLPILSPQNIAEIKRIVRKAYDHGSLVEEAKKVEPLIQRLIKNKKHKALLQEQDQRLIERFNKDLHPKNYHGFPQPATINEAYLERVMQIAKRYEMWIKETRKK